LKQSELARNGKVHGGPVPYGFRRSETVGYEPDPATAPIVGEMAQRIIEGWSLLAVERDLNARGVPAPAGGKWRYGQVRRVLLTPSIAGLRKYQGEAVGKAEWDEIVPRSTWEQVRAHLADPARKRTRPARTYLLSGLVFTEDGAAMASRPDQWKKGVKGFTRRSYAGRSEAGKGCAVDADALEAIVVEMVLGWLDRATFPPEDTDTADTAVAEAIAAVEADMAELVEARGQNKMTLAQFLALNEPLLAALEDLHARAPRQQPHSGVAALVGKPGEARSRWTVAEADGGFSAEQRRRIIAWVVDRVVVRRIPPGKSPRSYPVSGRVDVIPRTWISAQGRPDSDADVV
jgi:hypothetical protein